jgi:hypothetical protein
MNIQFIQEGTSVFAEAYNEVINGYSHELLLIAEINPRLGAYEVRFESAWNSPAYCDTLEAAKELVLKTHSKYKPSSLGRNYFLG